MRLGDRLPRTTQALPRSRVARTGVAEAIRAAALGLGLGAGCAPNTDVYEACSRVVEAQNRCLEKAPPDTDTGYETVEGLCGQWQGQEDAYDAATFDCIRRYYNTAHCAEHYPAGDDIDGACE